MCLCPLRESVTIKKSIPVRIGMFLLKLKAAACFLFHFRELSEVRKLLGQLEGVQLKTAQIIKIIRPLTSRYAIRNLALASNVSGAISTK